MADALCGPSNPLQNFQKHTSADRTLQQDRFTSRAGPSQQGFRSDPGPSAGLLDPEFEAFQTGQPPGFADSQLLHQARHNFPPSPGIASYSPSNAAGWASDFQRLHISQPPPQSQLRPQPAAAGWHLDFQRQQPSPSLQQSSQTFPFQNAQPRYNFNPSLGMQTPYSYSPYTQDVQSNNNLSRAAEPRIQYDDAAFEQEFEAHASRLLQQNAEEQTQRTSTELGQDVLVDGPDVLQSMDDNAMYTEFGITDAQTKLRESESRVADEFEQMSSQTDDLMKNLREEAEQRRRVEDFTDNYLEETSQPGQQDREQNRGKTDEDLARTAGELLERVADETSTKFRESSFLSLMVQLRDREVRVEGDKIVSNETNEVVTNEFDQVAAKANHDSTAMLLPTATTTRQRASSVPRRRNPASLDLDPSRDFRMAGALRDDALLDNPGAPPANRRMAPENFERWLHENGLQSTHMVNDF